MAYRSFSTGTWQDPWFEKLNPKAKLLFIYLWTNDVCTQSGVYQISQRRAEFETGLKPQEIINDLHPKVEWFADVEIVWVKNFFRKQCANAKFALAGIRSLSCIPQNIVEKFAHYNADLIEKMGIDTVSIPYKTEFDTLPLSVTGTVTGTVPGTGTARRGRVCVVDVGFEDFWKAYPKKVGKEEAKRAWLKFNGSRPPVETIVLKINELKKSSQWSKENGQFIPNPATWLNRGGWEDECRVDVKRQRPMTFDEIEEMEKNGL